MRLNNSQPKELIDNLEKIKSYLEGKSKLEPSYKKLIEIINQKIDIIKHNDKPTIKLIGFSSTLLSKLKAVIESNSELRSLYSFDAISNLSNFQEIINYCSAIFLVYQSDQNISENQHKLIELAQKKDISVFILVKQNKPNSSQFSLSQWIESQNYLAKDSYILPIDNFFELKSLQHVQIYQQLLIDHLPRFTKHFVRQYSENLIGEIEQFIEDQKIISWREIKQIKEKYLQGREIHNYQQQILVKTFNKIDRQQQQTILTLKQQINQSRSNYLNLFLPNSWMFKLQQDIEKTKIKLVEEFHKTYVYLTITNGKHTEYFHSYILNQYQQQINDVLNSQWIEITRVEKENILASFVTEANEKTNKISLLKNLDTEPLSVKLELSPKLDLTNIVDFSCLKVNSRIIFDHNYTQSNWFKILISVLIGTSIYITTKIYFGEGKYVGFFILIFQIINILTGQSVKKIKLKNHQKELQRIVTTKYQVLIRLIVEQMTQSLIISLDRINKQYRQNIDEISDLAQNKLNEIKQDIDELRLRQKYLEKDISIIKSWFN